MTTLIVLMLYGHAVYIDAEEMYDVYSVQSCKEILPSVIRAWGASGGNCLTGDILLPAQAT